MADTEQLDGRLEPLVLSAEQTAAWLLVTADTIKNLHRVGTLRGIKIGKHLRFRIRDVEKFVETAGADDE